MKASRNNRGSTPDIERMDWRTPVPLVRAIEQHFDLLFVMDAAASEGKSLCDIFINKALNTLTMEPARMLALYRRAVTIYQARTVHPIKNPAIWCNPEYFSSEELLQWIKVGARFAATYEIPWVFLLPGSRDEQDWFHETIAWGAQYAYPKGRVPYHLPDGTPGDSPNHPSVVIAFEAPQAGPRQVTSLPNEWRKMLPKRKPKPKATKA